MDEERRAPVDYLLTRFESGEAASVDGSLVGDLDVLTAVSNIDRKLILLLEDGRTFDGRICIVEGTNDVHFLSSV